MQYNYITDTPQCQKNAPSGGLSSEQSFGLLFEEWAAEELKKLGYDAQLLADFSARFDILLDSHLPVEVKAARPTKHWTGKTWRTRWQFDLSGGIDEDRIYILIAVDSNGEIFPFVVPSSFMGERRTACLTSHPQKYQGWLKEFINAWDWVQKVSAWALKYRQIKAGQLSLF